MWNLSLNPESSEKENISKTSMNISSDSHIQKLVKLNYKNNELQKSILQNVKNIYAANWEIYNVENAVKMIKIYICYLFIYL